MSKMRPSSRRRAEEVLTTSSFLYGGAVLAHQGDHILLIVGLDLQGLQDWPSNQERSLSRNNEALDATSCATHPDWQMAAPVRPADVVTTEEEVFVDAKE